MVVVWILVANQAEMGDGLIVLPAVDGQRGRVQPFFDRLRRVFTGRDLPLADVQIEAHAFKKLLLVWKLGEHRFEQLRGPGVIVVLKRFQPLLVDGNRLEICRASLRQRLADRLISGGRCPMCRR